MPVTNPDVLKLRLLGDMYDDSYFPDHLVKQGEAILLRLCEVLENNPPDGLAALYVLTQQATEQFNDLQDAFDEAGSEIETVARDSIGESFYLIARAYGFEDADPEELIATRDW
ncbi:TPA: hypothetical protein RG728_001592 [Morganella morganii subsp. morganii]|uniref:Uncharacterized protein n=1 Tax=Morganella morganii TaxID=582 RepID=A0AAU8ZKS6_MORMO|nr:DUF5713 family protein [Morganella morganii]AWC93624.1 hypothetical protein AM380_08285 [Morganella morganii]EKW8486868.1 hypothetical protein [Morganella morganii]HAT3625275.1 hypothetical protein [Morganella morganii]HDU8692497.1 hypothetical protein [Morganella morganii subsp. morganii]